MNITIDVGDQDAAEIVRRSGGWRDAKGDWSWGGGAAEHHGPFPLRDALIIALRSIAAGGAMDT